MKLKKILVFILCIGISICLVGCGNQNTTNAVANNLDKNTAKLETVLDKMQDVNYKNIVIEDISPLSDETFNTISNINVLKKTKWYSVNGNVANDFVPTKVSADKRRDAKYVNGDDIQGYGIGEQIPEPVKARKLAKKLANTNSFNNAQNVYNNSNSTYKPRYINSVSESFNRDCLDNYFKQIEIIYEECADCISCNAECKNEKVILQQNISDCRTLVKKMRDGTIQLSAADITKCNNCMKTLNESVNRLSSTKTNVNSKEKNILSLKENFSNKKDQLQTAYIKLLDALENRLDCLSQCNDCLNCICNTINNSKVDMTDALENRTDEDKIKDYEKEENLQENRNFSNIDTMNNYSINQDDYVKNQTVNQQTTYNNQPYQTQYPQNYGFNNGYGYNNGFYNNNMPYPPRNIDTYNLINKNIDTYSPFQKQTEISKQENNEYDEDNSNKDEPYLYSEHNEQNDNNSTTKPKIKELNSSR